VRVADAVSRLRLLAADFTLLCHGPLPNDSDLVGRRLPDERLILQELPHFRQSQTLADAQ
jgi:hypothetical protein